MPPLLEEVPVRAEESLAPLKRKTDKGIFQTSPNAYSSPGVYPNRKNRAGAVISLPLPEAYRAI